MPDTLSAILSKPTATRERAALHVGLAAETVRQQPARFALVDVDQVTIGRGSTQTATRTTTDGERTLAIMLPDARLSTHHARITKLGGRWILEDLGSKNGTWLGGEAIQQHTLDDNDVIEVGHTMLVFRAHGGEAGDLAQLAPVSDGLATLSPGLAERFATIARGAPSNVPVMIRGDTGTGKELVARAVHALSGRKGPFVAVNCGAVPAHLVEAELFGHRKGAFTGAGDERVGLVRSADGGTLFLDEIGELPASAQAALLRVLQEGEVLPIGTDKPVRVDVRLVTATLRDLEADVAAGSFRTDLLGRVLGLSIALPPLRERPEDLSLLVQTLLDRVARGRNLRLSPDVVRALYAHPWPRNIRELERALASASALTLERIELEHLPDPVRAAAPPPRLVPTLSQLSADERKQRDDVAAALLRHNGNIAAVARELGKDRTQIRRWMRRFGLSRSDDD
ncbi:MAG TPA: sigma 54-interacting transcriptional regulator [Kofleriaceae bacterium]|nr:sigma 54-interacting transcriptional regulator [Kofleriaceae bacterium]